MVYHILLESECVSDLSSIASGGYIVLEVTLAIRIIGYHTFVIK